MDPCWSRPGNPDPAAPSRTALWAEPGLSPSAQSLLQSTSHDSQHSGTGKTRHILSDLPSFVPQGRLVPVSTPAHTLCQHGCGAPWQPRQAGNLFLDFPWLVGTYCVLRHSFPKLKGGRKARWA